jgi:hypothetical protein
MVEPMGFEPTTSSMPSRRAPNCATAPPTTEVVLSFIAPDIWRVKQTVRLAYTREGTRKSF